MMHRVPSDYVSLFIRGVQWTAEDRGMSVARTLKEMAQARLVATGEGLALVGTSTDGSSVNYSVPSINNGMTLTPETLALMLGRLLDWVDEITAANPSATDAQILAGLRTRNAPVRVYRPNFVLQSPR
jgi:hypothetical protein